MAVSWWRESRVGRSCPQAGSSSPDDAFIPTGLNLNSWPPSPIPGPRSWHHQSSFGHKRGATPPSPTHLASSPSQVCAPCSREAASPSLPPAPLPDRIPGQPGARLPHRLTGHRCFARRPRLRLCVPCPCQDPITPPPWGPPLYPCASWSPWASGLTSLPLAAAPHPLASGTAEPVSLASRTCSTAPSMTRPAAPTPAFSLLHPRTRNGASHSSCSINTY